MQPANWEVISNSKEAGQTTTLLPCHVRQKNKLVLIGVLSQYRDSYVIITRQIIIPRSQGRLALHCHVNWLCFKVTSACRYYNSGDRIHMLFAANSINFGNYLYLLERSRIGYCTNKYPMRNLECCLGSLFLFTAMARSI